MSRNILVDSSVRLLFSVPLPELELHAGMMLSGGRITSEGFTVTGRISISRLSSVSRLLSADPDPEPEAAPELPADLPEAKLQIVPLRPWWAQRSLGARSARILACSMLEHERSL